VVVFNDSGRATAMRGGSTLAKSGGRRTRIFWNHALESAFDACRRNRPLLNAYRLKIIPVRLCDFSQPVEVGRTRGAGHGRGLLFELKP
jgi:hypothetical protein